MIVLATLFIIFTLILLHPQVLHLAHHQDDDDEEGGGEKFPDMEKNPFSELADNESLYVEVTLEQDHYKGRD